MMPILIFQLQLQSRIHMINGQQKGQENLKIFLAWVTQKNDSDFKEYIFRGKLNKSDIASECGFAKSALRQNPAIATVLPELADSTDKRVAIPLVDKAGLSSRKDKQRLNVLEQQNAMLTAKLQQAEEKLKKFEVMDEYLSDLGRFPR
jgi:hypothetical protein